MLRLRERDIQEMEADAHFFIKQLIADRRTLQDEISDLKRENEMLKGRLENE